MDVLLNAMAEKSRGSPYGCAISRSAHGAQSVDQARAAAAGGDAGTILTASCR